MNAPVPEISLVLPCYNEAESLPDSIPPLAAALAALGRPFEILLVDNGSTDATASAMARLARELPSIRTLALSPNRGYGGGVLAGLQAAGGRWVAFLGADGQVPPGQVAGVIREALSSPPRTLVKALRRNRGDGALRWIVSKAYNLTCRILVAAPSRDMNATPKVLRREDLPELHLAATDWFLDAECVLKAKARGFSLKEVPVDCLPRRGGVSHVRLPAVAEFLGNLWRHRRRTA